MQQLSVHSATHLGFLGMSIHVDFLVLHAWQSSNNIALRGGSICITTFRFLALRSYYLVVVLRLCQNKTLVQLLARKSVSRPKDPVQAQIEPLAAGDIIWIQGKFLSRFTTSESSQRGFNVRSSPQSLVIFRTRTPRRPYLVVLQLIYLLSVQVMPACHSVAAELKKL